MRTYLCVVHKNGRACWARLGGGSRLSLNVTFNIITRPLELYYSWDQCWDSTRPDTGQLIPLRLFPSIPTCLHCASSIILRRLFSLHRSPASAELELWGLGTWKQFSPQGMTASERRTAAPLTPRLKAGGKIVEERGKRCKNVGLQGWVSVRHPTKTREVWTCYVSLNSLGQSFIIPYSTSRGEQ